MATPPEGQQRLASEQDVVLARQAVRKLTQELRFSLVDQTKMITAASELSRNTVVYGRGGVMRWQVLEEGLRRGLRLHFEDQGPGIADVTLALTDGFTSGSGLGVGLPGSKRLVHEFEIRTAPGQGTCVTIARWR
jgi:serine/threonine-protein kinase RsbT